MTWHEIRWVGRIQVRSLLRLIRRAVLGDAFRLLAIDVWLFTATSGSIGVRLLGGLSGVIADRYDKYSILVTSDLARTVVGLGLAWCAVADQPAVALVLVAVGNALDVFFASSSLAVLHRLIRRRNCRAATV